MLHLVQDMQAPPIIPAGWHDYRPDGRPRAIVRDTGSALRALYSVDTLPDGKWRHISFSRRERYPGWDEMKEFIETCGFFRDDQEVVMILPPKKFYVNLHENCFHWWQKIK